MFLFSLTLRSCNRCNCLFEFCGETDSDANSESIGDSHAGSNPDTYDDQQQESVSIARELLTCVLIRVLVRGLEGEFARKRARSIKGDLPSR
jgi:hypothetical protein